MNLSDNSPGPPDDNTMSDDLSASKSLRINPSETLKTALTQGYSENTNVDKLEFSADDSDPSEKAKIAPIPMAGVGKTLIFPRKDTIFKKKESLPFDEI